MRLKCLAQEHDAVPWPGLEPGLLNRQVRMKIYLSAKKICLSVTTRLTTLFPKPSYYFLYTTTCMLEYLLNYLFVINGFLLFWFISLLISLFRLEYILWIMATLTLSLYGLLCFFLMKFSRWSHLLNFIAWMVWQQLAVTVNFMTRYCRPLLLHW